MHRFVTLLSKCPALHSLQFSLSLEILAVHIFRVFSMLLKSHVVLYSILVLPNLKWFFYRMPRMPSVKWPASGFKDARSGLTGQRVNLQLLKAFRTVSFNSQHSSSWFHRNKLVLLFEHLFACWDTAKLPDFLFIYHWGFFWRGGWGFFCLSWSFSCFSDGSKHLKFDDIVTQSSPQNCTVYCGGIQAGLTGKCDFW